MNNDQAICRQAESWRCWSWRLEWGQKPPAGGRASRVTSTGASGGKATLLTPWFQSSESDFRLLPSRTVRAYISLKMFLSFSGFIFFMLALFLGRFSLVVTKMASCYLRTFWKKKRLILSNSSNKGTRVNSFLKHIGLSIHPWISNCGLEM